MGFENYDDLKDDYYKGVNRPVGSKTFIEKIKEAFGFRAKGRKIICADDAFELREVLTPCGKANNLDFGNTLLWD